MKILKFSKEENMNLEDFDKFVKITCNEASCVYNKDYTTCNLKEIDIGIRILSNHPHGIPATCTSYSTEKPIS